jgi:hypothetical protein
MNKKLSRMALVSSSLVTLIATDAFAGKAVCVDSKLCNSELVGKRLNDSTVENVAAGENTESKTVLPTKAPMFSISVDGQHLAGTVVPKDLQRKTDLALEAVDIQVKFDGLDVKPILNVSTYPPRQTYLGGEQVNFLASSNYPAWIAKSEILIFRAGDEGRGEPFAVIPASKQGAALRFAGD